MFEEFDTKSMHELGEDFRNPKEWELWAWIITTGMFLALIFFG